jgi:hypothetical protein
MYVLAPLTNLLINKKTSPNITKTRTDPRTGYPWDHTCHYNGMNYILRLQQVVRKNPSWGYGAMTGTSRTSVRSSHHFFPILFFLLFICLNSRSQLTSIQPPPTFFIYIFL